MRSSRSRYASGSGWIMDTRFTTTRRSAPATSTPCENAPWSTWRSPKRNSATAKEPTVSAVRVFLRTRLATIRRVYFMGPRSSRPVHERALLHVADDVGALRGERVVRDHEHRLAILAHEPVEQVEHLVRALAIE